MLHGLLTFFQIVLRCCLALQQLSMPYWSSPEVGASARWKLAGVVGLTLATTGVRWETGSVRVGASSRQAQLTTAECVRGSVL